MDVERVNVVWFRQDLRISDNPALLHAAKQGCILPIYILDDENAGNAAMGTASRIWLYHSLTSLSQSLDGHLHVFSGDAISIIKKITETYPVVSVFWNRCYEPWRIKRDAIIKNDLRERNITVKSFNASLLWEPWTVLKKDTTPYQVFTPYYQKGCLGKGQPRPAEPAPQAMHCFGETTSSAFSINELGLLPGELWRQTVLDNWDIGEQAAERKFDRFCANTLGDYRQGRDFPALSATSTLSPHLHFGEISPNQIWQRMELESIIQDSDNRQHFKRELAWREFSYYQLYHFPRLADQAFKSKYDNISWLDDETGLQHWQQGKTGFPIVDAGMRELWETGTMHNRVRMIVASFLVKNLLIDWRKGAAWFWDCLLDADLASNSASWQWCAGSGADATPYFRIFNPVLQSEKFDPYGEYLSRYCPELNGLPLKYRHKPWQASDEVLQRAGIELGVDYPNPILDLKTTRQRALDAFKGIRQG